jgi:predicted ATPase
MSETTAPPVRRRKKGLLLEEAWFREKYRCFAKEEAIEFHPGVNLLVGDQGCGKSSLLQLIRDLGAQDSFAREHAQEVLAVTCHSCPIEALNFEQQNPRTVSAMPDSLNGVQWMLKSAVASHGETVNALLNTLGKKKRKTLVLLDEPDMALSPRSAYALAGKLAELAANGHQIIAAVHNPIVIQAQKEVLSLEQRAWITPEDFLANQVS